jgi:phage terminase large subunit
VSAPPRLEDVLGRSPRIVTGRDKFAAALDVLKPEEPTNLVYPKDPIDFMRDILGIDPWDGQEAIVRAVFANRYTSVASCHGIGKSFITAALAITFLHVYENSIVLSTAPTGRQVEHVLWRNIRTLYSKSKKPLLGRPPLTTRYDISTDWYAIGFKPTEQDTDPVQGFHAEYVLVIIDEAAGVPATLIDGMQAALTTAESRLLMIGNPTSTSGPFYDSHHGAASLYKTMNFAFADTPNAKAGKTVKKYLITQEWVDDVLKKYGEESAYYQSRVLARWVSPEDVLIPLSQIEAARNRQEIEFAMGEGRKQAGLDVARGGTDNSVLTLRDGSWARGSWEVKGKESWETVGHTFEIIKQEQPDTEVLNIDVIGVGAAVYDTARRMAEALMPNLSVVGVNFSSTPEDTEAYNNQRSEAYGVTASRFRTGDIGGNIADGVLADLSSIKYRFDARHTQPVIEPKDDFRKRTGRSPDYGDSFVLAFYVAPIQDAPKMGALAFGYADTKWGRL